MTVLFPGSFDPVTKGHMDIIKRACALFDSVVVGVFANISKKGAFEPEMRVRMIEKACHGLSRVSVQAFSCGLLQGAGQVGARAIIRGLRSVTDFEYELPWAQLNHAQAPDVEIIFLATDPALSLASSSAVREMAALGYDISPYVPKEIENDVINALRRQ